MREDGERSVFWSLSLRISFSENRREYDQPFENQIYKFKAPVSSQTKK